MTSELNMHPLHLEDLKRSGLSDRVIIEAGIKSVPPNQINKRLGFNLSGLSSMYEIPYGNGFSRYKAFYDDSKEGPKYIQPRGSGNRLYIPKLSEAILTDNSIPIYITEGEKKALKANQEGLPCIGLSGLWNWSNGSKELIGDFDLIAFNRRTVFIVPDNDYLLPDKNGYRKNLEEAVNSFAYQLFQRGAEAYIIQLPSCELKGLDDYLCKHTTENFKSLPKKQFLPLKEAIAEATNDDIHSLLERIAKETKTESEKDLYKNLLAKKFKLSKRSIHNDMKQLKPGKADRDKTKVIVTAQLPGLVDLVKDAKGNVAFLIKEDHLLKITNRVVQNGTVYTPPNSAHLPFALVNGDDVVRCYEEGDDLGLFDLVRNHLKKYSYLKDDQWLILIHFVFLTYLQDHSDISYLPMILFFAVPERGKSRTGKSMTFICYRGVHCVDLRETNLFRYSENLNATIFLDIMDLWKKAERNQSEDVLLQRFEKGAQVSRVLYPEKGAFEDTKYYKVYGPTLIASNEAVHKILDTRCIPFSMPNKPGRYNNPSLDQALPIKTQLIAWRALYMDKPLPEIDPIQGIEGRLWDITIPLFQVCKIVAPEHYNDLVSAMLEIAKQRRSDKGETYEGKIISIIYDLSPKCMDSDYSWDISTSDVLKKLNEDRPENQQKSSQWLGRKLKAIGITTSRVTGRSIITITRDELDTLTSQYGLINEEDHAFEENSENSENSKTESMKNTCPPESEFVEDLRLPKRNAKS